MSEGYTAGFADALKDYLDPATGFFPLAEGVHWSQVLTQDATISVPDDALYQMLRRHVHHLVVENQMIPTKRELAARLGPNWQDEVERSGVKKYWPDVTRLNERAQLGIAQTLNDWGWVGTCAQVAGAQAQETYRREKHLGPPGSRRPSESDLARLCEREGIGFTEHKAARWMAEGILVVMEDQAGDLLESCWETISKHALNQQIEEKARRVDPGAEHFQRPDIQQIGEWAGLPITRNLDHQKVDPIFSRMLIAIERAQEIASRCGQPELLAHLSHQGAILTESDILQAVRDQVAVEDALPETGEIYCIKYLLGFAYPEDMQRVSLLDPDGVRFLWRANLIREGDGGTELVGFGRDPISGECFVGGPAPMTMQQLQSRIEASGMVVATIHAPWWEGGPPAQMAGHSIAVHHVEEEQALCFVNDSGPWRVLERVGWFLTREGIIPIAGFASAKNVQFTYAQMEHWLHGYQEIYLGDTPVRLCANTLIPTTRESIS